jgi:very-short-patch-repair endonuclease
MAPPRLRIPIRSVWDLATEQHGVVTRSQLLALGLSADAIRHRVDRRRLHPVHRGVYAVGRAQLTRHGWWMAGVLACGPDALLSHRSAAELWSIVGPRNPTMREGETQAPSVIHVSVPPQISRRRTGLRIHRRALSPEDQMCQARIPVTSPARTLADLASMVAMAELEAAVNEGDKLGLVDPEALRTFVGRRPGLEGVWALRSILDRRAFRLTDSELERRFLRLVDRAGLPRPLTQQRVNGFRVDFFWPELGLVVETDGLRYHRTPAQQSRDRVRDQAHATAGFVALRFTHAQVAFGEARVASVLRAVAERQRLGRLGRAHRGF